VSDTLPRIVLVRPRTPANVGATARAMKNFGLEDLVLVDPRLHSAHDTPGEEPVFERESRQMAWGALDILGGARRAGTVDEALEGCGFALGTAPGPVRPLRTYSPEAGIEALFEHSEPTPALVFGSESSGFTSDEAARLSGVVVIPTDPAQPDLNLAQSVVVLAYLRFARTLSHRPPARAPRRADHGLVEAGGDRLLDLAVRSGFLQEPGQPVGREIRALLHRVGLTAREAEVLRGLFTKIGRTMDHLEKKHPPQSRGDAEVKREEGRQ